MPIYEYQCDACGKRSSSLLPRFDSPDPACPNCGQPRLHRLVSTFATTGGGGDDEFGGEPEGYGEGMGDEGGDVDDDDW
jgi:putative FmdB family regulatory protein